MQTAKSFPHDHRYLVYANSLLASLNTRNELRMIHTPRTRWRDTRSRDKDPSIPLRTRKSQEVTLAYIEGACSDLYRRPRLTSKEGAEKKAGKF